MPGNTRKDAIKYCENIKKSIEKRKENHTFLLLFLLCPIRHHHPPFFHNPLDIAEKNDIVVSVRFPIAGESIGLPHHERIDLP